MRWLTYVFYENRMCSRLSGSICSIIDYKERKGNDYKERKGMSTAWLTITITTLRDWLS